MLYFSYNDRFEKQLLFMRNQIIGVVKTTGFSNKSVTIEMLSPINLISFSI